MKKFEKFKIEAYKVSSMFNEFFSRKLFQFLQPGSKKFKLFVN